MMTYATVDDVIAIWRSLTNEEMERTEQLLPIVEASLRVEAERVGKDLDQLAETPSYQQVLKSVIVDVVARTLMTATDQEPMTQSSESALGYSFSGTFLVPGGGLFIKRTELARLGLRRQRWGAKEIYETDQRYNGLFASEDTDGDEPFW